LILAEIYKKGTVRFVPELVLSENSLPPEALLESVTDIKYDPQGNIYFCDFRANKKWGHESVSPFFFYQKENSIPA
jgi:hypothetical protein